MAEALSLPSWKVWLMAIRPPTLLAGIAPVVLGISLAATKAETALSPLSIAAALALALLLQAAANLVNDAKDAERGVDTLERLGPVRVVQRGLLTREAVRGAYYFCFGIAGLIAIWLFWQEKDWLIPGVAAACGLAAYAYTAGPFPLAYYALGEIVALIFFGPIAVMGSSYLQTHQIDTDIAFWGLGPGLIAAAIMAINNARDFKGDAFAGKHTLATLLGEKGGRRLPLVLLLLSVALCGFYAYQHHKLVSGLGLVALLLLAIVRGIAPLLGGPPAGLNQALKRTALFNFFYALSFAWLV